MIKIIELHHEYTDELIDAKSGEVFALEDEMILQDLQTIVSSQELTRLDSNNSSNDLYSKQAKLYSKIHDLNDMGLNSFIGDTLAIKKFNLHLLNK